MIDRTNPLNDIAKLSVELPIVKGGEDGYLYYRLPEGLNQKQQETAQIILQTLATGFQNLREEYPKYISIQNLRIKGGASK